MAISILLSAGCGSGSTSPSSDSGLELAVAPLSLTNIGYACYDFRVSNATNQTVTSRGNPANTKAGRDQTAAPAARGATGPLTADGTTVCSSDFGNAAGGDITYITPCDADGADTDNDGLGEQQNTVTVWIDGLYDAGGVDIAEWRDPCGTAGCALAFTCEENRDALVQFDFTIMRDANQGFFDVAVNFEDIFCSAKLDTCYGSNPGNQSVIELLMGGDAERDPTAVFGFGCTAGTAPGVTTRLMYGAVTLECTQGTFYIDPLTGPGTASTQANGITVHYATYRGTEALQCEGSSCNKAYWNLAIDLVGSNSGGADVALTNCELAFQATADDGAGFLNGLPSATNGAYPFIDVETTLTTQAGAPICQKNPLNGTDPLRLAPSNVTTVYQGKAGGIGGIATAPPMCSAFNGTVAASTNACGTPTLRVEASGAPVTTHDFGAYPQGFAPNPAVTFTVRNVGDGPTVPLATTFSGNAAVFAVTQDLCVGSVLPAGGTCTVEVTLLSATGPAGTHTASLTVASGLVNGTVSPIGATLEPPLGTVINSTQFTTGSPRELTVDTQGNAWACNAGIFVNTTWVYKVTPAGTKTEYPIADCEGIDSDAAGNVWAVARNSAATNEPPLLWRFAPGGGVTSTPVLATPEGNVGTLPIGVRVAPNGQAWVLIRQPAPGRSGSRVSRFSSTGALLQTYEVCNFPVYISFETNRAWVSCSDGAAYSRINVDTGVVDTFGNSQGVGTSAWVDGSGFFLQAYDAVRVVEKVDPSTGGVVGSAPGDGFIVPTDSNTFWTLHPSTGALLEYGPALGAPVRTLASLGKSIGSATYDGANNLLWLTHPSEDQLSYISLVNLAVTTISGVGNQPVQSALRGTSNLWLSVQNESGGNGFIVQVAR